MQSLCYKPRELFVYFLITAFLVGCTGSARGVLNPQSLQQPSSSYNNIELKAVIYDREGVFSNYVEEIKMQSSIVYLETGKAWRSSLVRELRKLFSEVIVIGPQDDVEKFENDRVLILVPSSLKISTDSGNMQVGVEVELLNSKDLSRMTLYTTQEQTPVDDIGYFTYYYVNFLLVMFSAGLLTQVALNINARQRRGYMDESAVVIIPKVVQKITKYLQNEPIVANYAKYGRPDIPTTVTGQDRFQEVETKKPTIKIGSPSNNDKIDNKSVDVQGTITALNQIKKIDVYRNKERLYFDEVTRGDNPSPVGLDKIKLDLRIPLVDGDNSIEIVVRDQEDIRVSKTILVKRVHLEDTASNLVMIKKLPKRMRDQALQQQQKESMSVDKVGDAIGDWVVQGAYKDYNIGNSMYDQGRLQEAVHHYQKAIKSRSFADANYNLGLAKKAQNLEDSAKEAFRKACNMKLAAGCAMMR